MRIMRSTIGTATLALLALASTVAVAQSPDSARSPVAPADASSSPVPMPPTRAITSHEVRQNLENMGYTQVNLRQDRDGWSGIATRKGKRILLDIDNHGTVRETE
jgi:hypothetical protein